MKILLASETKPLGQLLRERGLISEEDLKNALVLQQERTDKIGRILIDLGYVAERDILAVVSDQLKIPIFDGEYPAVPIEADRLPFRFLRAFNVIPVHLENGVLRIVMADPLDLETQNSIRLRTGFALQVFLGVEAEIQAQLERFHGGDDENSSEKLIETLGDFGADDENIEHLRDLASEAPVIRLVNLMISRAVEERASDIHIDPFEKALSLRYRVDGVLHNIDPPPNQLRAAIISRIKLMAKLNIAERRLPQDGRIKLKVLGREIDLRVSTLPTMYGESVVMRILDRSNSSLIDLRRLGFPDDLYEKICQMTSKPHGIFLVTGPTGSGKSTTLYSALKRINIPDRKIITIEDPIEYQMDGINQIHVNPQIGLTFAAGLRHIVRQDPDVIMVGEIRDRETADIAIRAALTGHLVFSTLHTNDAPSAITRLTDMGVENYLITSSLVSVLAQRLVRLICPHCKIEAGSRIAPNGERIESWRGAGCENCSGTGYTSRVGIFELMELNDEIRKLIMANGDASEITAAARRNGMQSLREDGWNKVRSGITTAAEGMPVTPED